MKAASYRQIAGDWMDLHRGLRLLREGDLEGRRRFSKPPPGQRPGPRPGRFSPTSDGSAKPAAPPPPPWKITKPPRPWWRTKKPPRRSSSG
jgi:hypothetical protein